MWADPVSLNQSYAKLIGKVVNTSDSQFCAGPHWEKIDFM